MNVPGAMMSVVTAQPMVSGGLQPQQIQATSIAQQPQMIHQQAHMIQTQAQTIQQQSQVVHFQAQTGMSGQQLQPIPVSMHLQQPQQQAQTESREGEEEEGKHQCKECDRVLSTKKEFLQHMYMHKENPKYICPICSKIFPSEPGFKRHVRAHQNRARRNLSCSICSMVFSARGDLEEHHRENHLQHKLFRCQLCGAQFSWQDNLNKHMRMHNTGPGESTGSGGASRSSSSTAASSEEPHNYKCEICDANFMDNTSLRIHSRSHSAQAKEAKKVYTCKVCAKEFKFDFSYIAHMNAHEKSKPSKTQGPLQMVTEYGEEAPDPGRKVITEIQLPQRSTSAEPTETMVQIDTSERPPYGITYTPPTDGIPPHKTKTVVQADGKHQTEFTVIEERRFVKSPFKGGRRSVGSNKVSPTQASPQPAKRRPVNPVLYDLPMTDERPHKCSFCDATFRWEVSLNIHEREHDPNYRPPEKTARGRPRSLEPGKDFTYRIVRRRDSDEEDDEEFEDYKGVEAARPKRRYRKKKDLEKAQAAFACTKPAEDQATTVVKLTRIQQDAGAQKDVNHATSVTGFMSQQQQQHNGAAVPHYVTSTATDQTQTPPNTNGLVAVLPPASIGLAVHPGAAGLPPGSISTGNGAAAATLLPSSNMGLGSAPVSEPGDPVYAVNHQGVHFQVLSDQTPPTQ